TLSHLNPEINPYLKKFLTAIELDTLPIQYGLPLFEKKGNWRDYLASRMGAAPEKLIVDIGCYKGKTLHDLAEKHADTGFIGFDITFKRVFISAERAEAKLLKNVVWGLV